MKVGKKRKVDQRLLDIVPWKVAANETSYQLRHAVRRARETANPPTYRHLAELLNLSTQRIPQLVDKAKREHDQGVLSPLQKYLGDGEKFAAISMVYAEDLPNFGGPRFVDNYGPRREFRQAQMQRIIGELGLLQKHVDRDWIHL